MSMQDPPKPFNKFDVKQSIINSGTTPFSKNLDGYYVRTSNTTKKNTCDLPDMFGSKVDFYINGSETFTTKFGFCMSLIAVAILVFFLVYEFMLFSDSEDASVQISTDFTSDTCNFDSSNNAWLIRMGLRRDNAYIKFSEMADYLSIKLITYTSTQVDGSETEWTVAPVIHMLTERFHDCSTLNTANFTNTSQIEGWYGNYGTSQLQGYLTCTDPGDGYLTSGSRISTSAEYFALEISPCSSTNADCKFATETSTLNNYQIFVDIVKSHVDVTDYYSPIKYQLSEIIDLYINVDLMKVYNVFFKQTTLTTDYNRIFGTLGFEEEIQFQTFDYMNTDNEKREVITSETPLAQIYFKSGYKSVYVSRSYLKIIDMLSNIGGFMEIIFQICTLAYSWYNSIRFEQYLLNKAMLYEPENTRKEDFDAHYFSFGFLWCYYLKEFWCCCCKKKYTRMNHKLELAKKKLELDMDIVKNTHTKHRAEIMESIQIKAYQRVLIPLAIMVQLEHELEEGEEKFESNESNKNLEDILQEDEQEGEDMTQVEAADMLVKRMENIDDLDFIERSLNLWLISILDIDLKKESVKNKKKKKSKFAKEIAQDGNVFHISMLDKLDIFKFLNKNNIYKGGSIDAEAIPSSKVFNSGSKQMLNDLQGVELLKRGKALLIFDF